MKKITYLVLCLLVGGLMTANAQYSFPAVAGPVNVPNGAPVTVNINDAANAAGVPAGMYATFSVSVDWAEGGAGGPYSSEADLSMTTTAGTVLIDPATTGALGSTANTTLTFEGAFTADYDPTVDGFMDIVLNQSWTGSDADWSNIVVTITPALTCTPPEGTAVLGTTDCNGADTFMIDYDITALGDGTPAIFDGTTTTTIAAIGQGMLGPYPIGTSITLTLQHGADTLCDVDLGTIYFECPPANDDCSGAEAIVCGVQYTGNTEFANPEDPDPGLCGTSAGTAGAVWYSFTGANSNDAGAVVGSVGDEVILDLSMSTFDTKIRVFEGTCGALVCVDGDDDGGTGTTSLLTLSTLVGTDYYVLVHGYNANVGAYTLDVTCVAPPSCIEPSALAVNVISGTEADLSWTDSNTPAATAWEYVIQAPGTGAPAGAGTATATNPVMVTTGLVEGTSYEFYVRTDCGGVYSAWTGPFEWDQLVPPANDDCANAEAIVCGGQYIGDTTAATPESPDPGTCGTSAGTAGAVWYTFTGANSNDVGAAVGSTGDEVTLDLSLSTFDTKIRVFEGTCGALVCVDGDDDGGTGTTSLLTLPTLVGTEYYVLVHGFSGNAGAYTLDVTCVAPPLCSPAVVDSSTIVDSCNPDGTGTFTVDIVVSDTGDAGSVFDDGTITYPVVVGTVTAGPYNSGDSVTIELTAVDAACSSTVGTFEFTCPQPPPANNDCAGAQSVTQETGIPDAASATAIPGTIENATASGLAAEACNGFTGTANDDVWYSFEALTEDVNVTFDDGTTFIDLVAVLYSGTCGSLTVVGCDDSGNPEEINATGLTVGNTYYARVFQYGTASTVGKDITVKVWSPSTLGTPEFENEAAFTFYPNPVKNTLTLSAQNTIEQIAMYNMLGQEVLRATPNTVDSDLDMSNLQTGTYFVKVTIANVTKTVRVIKQ